MLNLKTLTNYPLKTFTVNQEDVQKCFDFAEDLYEKQATSTKDHGNTDLARRSKEDFISDHVRGKIAEFAFQRFLQHNYHISFEVDLNIYPGEHNHDDGNDLATIFIGGEKRQFPYKTDIKGLPARGQWLLIESHKFWAQMFVVCKLVDIEDVQDFESNPYSYKDRDYRVSVLGYCINKNIFDIVSKQARFIFNQADRLYSSKLINRLNKTSSLKLSPPDFHQILLTNLAQINLEERYIGPNLKSRLNFGYPVKWLSNDWVSFIKILYTKSVKSK
jgi:hypothetical protein